MIIHDELETLRQYRHILNLRIANPRTCPRRAVEAEAELKDVNLKIADLNLKIEAAAIVPFKPV